MGDARRRRKSAPPRPRTVSVERYRSVIPDWPAFEEAVSRPEPNVFRVRTGRATVDEVLGRLAEQGYAVRALEGMPAFFEVVDGPRPVSMTLEHWAGLLYVQQASTGVAAPVLAPEPGERVLDLCAAPGGKTTHAADLMGDRGVVVASDPNEGRIRGLLGNIYRLGHPSIMVVSADGRDFPEEATFDRVLVDAPCSGEGTLRRRGGQPPNQSTSFVRYVTSVQEALLRKAIRLTRPGGTIVYSTCTFAPEENEAILTRVLADSPVELEPLSLPVPHAPGLTAFGDLRFDPRVEGAARIYPHHLDSGGLFLARLRKLEDGAPDRASAWSPVPLVFPDDPMPEAEARSLLELGLDSYLGHFQVEPGAFGGLSWLARGGRLWLHSADAWPVPAWKPTEAWRVVSLGFRAMEFDTKGRPRPTNDALQWLGDRIRARKVDLDREQALQILSGEPMPWGEKLEGLQVLRHRGLALGRGVPTPEGVRSEVSKVPAKDLRAILEGKGAVTPPPADD